MIGRMRATRMVMALLCAAAMPAAAQLTEDPATWLRADGQVVMDARVTDLMATLQAANLSLRTAAAAGTPRRDAAALAAASPRMLQSRNFNLGWRVAARLAAVAEGHTPGEWLDVASSFDLVLDRAVLTPGTRLHARLAPWFALTTPLQGEYEVRLAVVDEQGGELATAAEPLPKQMAAQDYSLATEKLPEGRYRLRYELKEGETVRARGARVFYVDGQWRARWTELRNLLRQAQLRGAAEPKAAAALAGVEWAAAAMESWLGNGPVGTAGGWHPFVETYALPRLPVLASANPDEEGWRQAERFARALAEGRDPFAGETGELRLARRDAQGTLLPFRLIVPPGEAKRPVVVLLHSFMGDEGTWFHALSSGKLAELAARHQALVFCPLNPIPFADPTPQRAEELEKTVAELADAFGGNRERVYLAGHGTAASEALVYGLGRKPAYTAVAAVAGAPPGLFDTKPGVDVPTLFVYSDADEVAPESELRKWAAYVDTRLKRGKSERLAKLSHVETARAALPKLFEFFLGTGAARP